MRVIKDRRRKGRQGYEKVLIKALIVIIILQILVPHSLVINKYDILRNGDEYKFKVRPLTPTTL